MMKEKRILLLGAYSMEVVECGGALLKNALNGGKSHAAIAFAGEKMQSDLKKSAEALTLGYNPSPKLGLKGKNNPVPNKSVSIPKAIKENTLKYTDCCKPLSIFFCR